MPKPSLIKWLRAHLTHSSVEFTWYGDAFNSLPWLLSQSVLGSTVDGAAGKTRTWTQPSPWPLCPFFTLHIFTPEPLRSTEEIDQNRKQRGSSNNTTRSVSCVKTSHKNLWPDTWQTHSHSFGAAAHPTHVNSELNYLLIVPPGGC